VSRKSRVARVTVLILMAGILVFGAAGCGYVKNVRDDVMDIGSVGVGVVPPVVPTDAGAKAVGPLPPALGIYGQVTDFFHLGALKKYTGDAEWDRRGLAITADSRTKIGIGPWHYVRINQKPVAANDYKTTDNKLDAWRSHMDNLKDPLFEAPAKTLIYREKYAAMPYMYKGWQDWEMVSAEVAIPEPFITHSGFYLRLGFDPSQIFDAALSILCLDLYQDAAYNFDGSLKYGAPGEE